ncbi:MAG: cation:proton antiporter [Gammaproteobacteria bacterium]
MFNPEGALFLLVLLTAAGLLQPLSVRFNIPYAVLLVILGFIGSEIATRILAVDIGIRWEHVKPLVFNVFIPILIFAAALKIDLSALWRNGLWIFILAVPMAVLGIFLVALFIYQGIGHPAGFPWESALLFAVLVSATDPAGLSGLFKKSDATNNLFVVLEGESLFNDAVAVVLFTLLLALFAHEATTPDYSFYIYDFIIVFTVGIGVGLVAGGLLVLCVKFIQHDYLRTLFSLLFCYGIYIVAGAELYVSNVMAVLSTGLMFGYFSRQVLGEGSFVPRFWEFAEHITTILIFLLAGITITLGMFTDRWFAMLMGIVVVLAVRAFIFFVLLPLLSLLPGIRDFSLLQRGLLTWGGVRGTVTLALALSLPLDVPGWYTIQSMAYGVVLFSLFVQLSSMPSLLGKCRPIPDN